jgi:hypothetical protein
MPKTSKVSRLAVRTTDLDLLQKGHPFTWGQLLEIHTLGRYQFVEYYGHEYKDGHPTGGLNKTTTFSLYVDGKSTSHSYNSLEEAMVGAIAFGSLERNEARWMTLAACKVLGITPS